MRRKQSETGFTMIEMIMVMVITGIIASVVGIFITKPVQAYLSSVRRAELSEEADGAMRLIARDLRAALPNSIACTGDIAGSGYKLEFLSILSGGRYREAQNTDDTAAPLTAGGSTTFDMIGKNANSTSTDARGNSASDPANRVVVGNLGSGVTGCYSYFDAFDSNAPTLSTGTTDYAAGKVGVGTNSYLTACLTGAPSDTSQKRDFGRFFVVGPAKTTYAWDATGGLTKNGVTVIAPTHVSGFQVACDSTKANVQLITFNLKLKDRDNEEVNLLRRVTIVNRP